MTPPALRSQPAGPIVAIIDAPTRLGSVDLPRGAEVHGRIAGTNGSRILLEFSFASVGGRKVTLKGVAMGADGRPGVPAAKGLGGVSDVASGAAGAAAQTLVGVVADVADNDLASAAIRGAGAPLVNKTSRINNEESVLVAERNVHFFIYVEST